MIDTSRPKREVKAALEDLMVAGVGRPRGLKSDTAWHADAAMARFTTHNRRFSRSQNSRHGLGFRLPSSG